MSRDGKASVRQLELPLGEPGGEAIAGTRGEDAPVEGTALLERVLEPENLRRRHDAGHRPPVSPPASDDRRCGIDRRRAGAAAGGGVGRAQGLHHLHSRPVLPIVRPHDRPSLAPSSPLGHRLQR